MVGVLGRLHAAALERPYLPNHVRDVGQRNEVAFAKPGHLFLVDVGKIERNPVEIGIHQLLQFPVADDVACLGGYPIMTYGPPVFWQTRVPVAQQGQVEFGTYRAQKRGESIGRAHFLAVKEHLPHCSAMGRGSSFLEPSSMSQSVPESPGWVPSAMSFVGPIKTSAT